VLILLAIGIKVILVSLNPFIVSLIPLNYRAIIGIIN
jgi:hypothetical protein